MTWSIMVGLQRTPTKTARPLLRGRAVRFGVAEVARLPTPGQTEVWRLPLRPEGFDRAWGSELLEATALLVGAVAQGDGAAVGAVVLRRTQAPELGLALSILRIALERLAVDHHRLAVQVHAARLVGRFFGHGGSLE